MYVPSHDILGLIGQEVNKIRQTAEPHRNYSGVVSEWAEIISAVDEYIEEPYEEGSDDREFLSNWENYRVDCADDGNLSWVDVGVGHRRLGAVATTGFGGFSGLLQRAAPPLESDESEEDEEDALFYHYDTYWKIREEIEDSWDDY